MPTILLVEEDSPSRESLALNLRAEGFDVITAPSGGESLRLADEHSPDLLILNLQSPELDNQVLRRLLHRCAPAPVLMRQTAGLEAQGNESPANWFGPAGLVSRVQALLGQGSASRSQPATSLTAGDLTLDLINRRAFRAGVALKLTQKEFDLLAELVRNQGYVLSREQLLIRVWGRYHAESSHTVDVHIRWLREKIEVTPSLPKRILTVRGAGYRLAT